ncbi:TEA domain family protein [Rhodotorula toruloides]|uniref:TEA domain family protein n=1 Tax=Rhodotorula toruloides TaxID=5286 RepID=A0A511KLE4_RHOTO|nr:TEA domain family protein [Rhodotorula toruloides]
MSRSSTRVAYKTSEIQLPSHTLEAPASSTSVASTSPLKTRASLRTRESSIASSSTAAVTPKKRARASIAPGAGEDNSPRSAKRGKKAEGGGDLWDAELDKVLYAGMALLPNMGRRTIWLEDDDESYGRNGLLGEYIRRRTGKIRNRTQVASHIAVLRKHNPNDRKLADLIIGHDVAPEDLNTTHWAELLGEDRFPETRKLAKEINDAVKEHRELVVQQQKARRKSHSGSPAPRKLRANDEDETDGLTSDVEALETPRRRGPGRPRKSVVASSSAASSSTPARARTPRKSLAAAVTPSSSAHAATTPGTASRRSTRRSLGADASAVETTTDDETPRRKLARASAAVAAPGSSSKAKGKAKVPTRKDSSPPPPVPAIPDSIATESSSATMDVDTVAQDNTHVEVVPATAGESVESGLAGESGTGGWFSGVKKGLMRLVGY